MLAHGVQVALGAAGPAGLGSLLGPTVARNRRTASRTLPRDAHDARVGALLAAVAEHAAGAAQTEATPGPGGQG